MKTVDMKKTTAITKRLNALLKKEGFAIVTTRLIIGGRGQEVYDMEYQRDGETVHITTHKKPTRRKAVNVA
jgi:hypothetical protein